MAGMTEDGSNASRAPSGDLERLEEEDKGPLLARDCLVQQEDCIDNDYLLGSLDLVGVEAENCAVIAIGLCHGKLLVGVPETVWHRSLSKRRLQPKALNKAVLVAVVACRSGQRLADEDIVASCKVWIGLLDPQMEKDLTFMEDLSFDHHFGKIGEELALPYGRALVEVANEHFGFVTAESEVKQPPMEPGAPPLEERMQILEANLEAIKGSLAVLTGNAPGGHPAVPLPEKAKGREKVVDRKPALKGMDPTTVQAALQAGVPMEHLEEMSKILRTRPQKLEDVPRKAAMQKPAKRGPLDETEDEDGDGEAELIPAEDGSAGPKGAENLETAVIKLTAIASKLAGEGKERIDQILDGGGGAGSQGEPGGHPSSRKNSVALRALQRCLREDPKYIYQVVEANLQGDFLGRAASAGEPRVPGTTVRGWLTSRSRVQNYQQHVRWCWALGGIWDALVEGRTEEARARCALMMCAADQAAIDNGNWLMSTVALLEPVPPYQQFANHTAPSAAEAQYSALYDPRWAEIFLTHLKEVDSFVDTKKKLGNKSTPGKNDKEEESSERARVAAAKAKKKAERAERARAQRAGSSEGGGGA